MVKHGENAHAGEHELNLLEMVLIKLRSVRNKLSYQTDAVLLKQNNPVDCVECVSLFSV